MVKHGQNIKYFTAVDFYGSTFINEIHMETTFILLISTGIVFLSMFGNICLGRTLIKTKGPLKVDSARFNNSSTNLLNTIIVVPLSEILDNIYQLLAHAPTCQSSRSRAFTPVQKILHDAREAGTNASLR